ncbi:MAG: hypothetical protein K0R39_5184 [Symbiobacteriaceae bacterium]|nr:hypothetical protein [Symbiobacteriaceae bacterium]
MAGLFVQLMRPCRRPPLGAPPAFARWPLENPCAGGRRARFRPANGGLRRLRFRPANGGLRRLRPSAHEKPRCYQAKVGAEASVLAGTLPEGARVRRPEPAPGGRPPPLLAPDPVHATFAYETGENPCKDGVSSRSSPGTLVTSPDVPSAHAFSEGCHARVG